MAYTNKRKIHIARGSSANLLNGAKFTEEKDRIQNAGQPAFIEDKFYLTVGDKSNTKRFDQQVPIRVRTVDGYISDTEDVTNNTFQLSNKRENRYTLTGVKENDTPVVYLSSNSKFEIRIGTTSIINIDEAGTRALINPAKYLESQNIRSKNIKDLSGNDRIGFDSANLSSTTYNINLKDNTLIDGKTFTSNTKTILNTSTDVNGTLNLNAATNLKGTITGKNSSNSDNGLIINGSTGAISSPDASITKLTSTTGTITSLTASTSSLGQASTTTLSVGGKLTLPNSTWHVVGDDVYIGDLDRGGQLGILGANGTTGISFVKYNSKQNPNSLPKSSSDDGQLTYDGSEFKFNNQVKVSGALTVSSINIV